MMSEAYEKPIALIRVTIGYHDLHDRIRIDGATVEGSSVRLWVTQRLARRLALYFIQAGSVAVLKNDMSSKDCTHNDELSDAEEPVACHIDDPEFLVNSIDVTQRQDDKVLLFKSDGAGVCAMFCLPNAATDMWLTGLTECFKIADWSPIAAEAKGQIDSGSLSTTIH